MTAPRVLSVAALLMASALASTAHADCPHAASPGEAGSLTTPAITQAGGCQWLPVEPAWLAAPRIVVDARLRRDLASALPINAIDRSSAASRIQADPSLPLTLVGSGLDRRSLDDFCIELIDAGASDVVALTGGVAMVRQQQAGDAARPALVSAAEAHAAWLDGTAELAIESAPKGWTRSRAEHEAIEAPTLADVLEGQDGSRALVIVAHALDRAALVHAGLGLHGAAAIYVVEGGIDAWRQHLDRWQRIALAADTPLRTPCALVDGGGR